MSKILVYFKIPVTFDSEDPKLVRYFHDYGISLDEFLDDEELILDFMIKSGAEHVSSIEVRA